MSGRWSNRFPGAALGSFEADIAVKRDGTFLALERLTAQTKYVPPMATEGTWRLTAKGLELTVARAYWLYEAGDSDKRPYWEAVTKVVVASWSGGGGLDVPLRLVNPFGLTDVRPVRFQRVDGRAALAKEEALVKTLSRLREQPRGYRAST